MMLMWYASVVAGYDRRISRLVMQQSIGNMTTIVVTEMNI